MKNHSGTLATCVRPLTPPQQVLKPHQEPDVPTEIRPEMAAEVANKASVVSSTGQSRVWRQIARFLGPRVGHDLRHRRQEAAATAEQRLQLFTAESSRVERKRERRRGRKNDDGTDSVASVAAERW